MEIVGILKEYLKYFKKFLRMCVLFKSGYVELLKDVYGKKGGSYKNFY